MGIELQISELIRALGEATAVITKNTAVGQQLLDIDGQLKGDGPPEMTAEQKKKWDLDVKKHKAEFEPEPVDVVTETKKPVDTSKKKPVVKEAKKIEPEAPAPVAAGKKPITFDNLRLKVLKWIAPPVKRGEEEEAQAIMMTLLKKYTGGKEFTVQNVPEKYYQNIVDYINTVEVK